MATSVSEERLPREPLRAETAKRARDEAALLREMQQLPGWGVVTAEWAAQAKAERRDLDNATTPEEVRTAQARLVGRRMPLVLVEELLRAGAEADEWLANPKAERPAAPNARDMGDALVRRRRSQTVDALLEHPGWKVLARHMIAMAHAASRLKEVCPPEIAPVLDGLRDAVAEPIAKLRNEIRRGMGAAAWLASHQAEAEQ